MAKPLHLSTIPRGTSQKRGTDGAALMGLTTPMPVQRVLWRLHEARVPRSNPWRPLHENVSVEVPRRAGKTEGILALGVGRCASTDDYSMVYAAQSGTKSRERFYGLLRRLRRYNSGGPWRARESRGEERIEWKNGSIMRFAPPKPDYFRGDAVDWAVLDEAQEVDEQDAADLIGSLLPIFDTLEGPQLTVAGTAGATRDGLLWEALEKGRRGLWGIVEYAAPEDVDLAVALYDERLWMRVHPGPAGVSKARALEVLRKRREQMDDEQFGREYLGIWPLASANSAFDAEQWQRLGRPLAAEQPTRVGLGFDVAPGATRASVLAAWRTPEGETWIEVIHTSADADFLGALGKKYRVPLTHDTASVETLALADEVARRFPGVTLRGLSTIEFATSCVTIDSEVRNGHLRHARQTPLDEAIEVASRRAIRDGGWAWGRVRSTGSIAPLVAATVALKGWDDLPPARRSRVLTAAV